MENTKTITLPSGATCRIRKITTRDALAWESMPNPYEELPDEEKAAGKKAKLDPIKAQERGLVIQETIFLKCIGLVTRSDGTKFRVTKICWEEAEDLKDRSQENWELFAETEDGAFAAQEVMELSGLTKAAREAARPFPEGQGAGGNISSDFEIVPEASQRIA